VVTAKETQLFTQYVNRLRERWAEELHEAETGTTNGLSRVLSDSQFNEAIRAFSDRVFAILRQEKASASVMLEKSPEHALHADSILKVYPQAMFLHIIRDPRAVSNSFRHAAHSWWSAAPSGPIETTRRWRKNVLAGRSIADLTPQYREVRYEDLLDDGERVLMRVFAWIGLEADNHFCQSALETCRIENLRGNRTNKMVQPWNLDREPQGFFRSGREDSWRADLSSKDIALIEYEVGDLMQSLGYDPASNPGPHYRARLRRRIHKLYNHAYLAALELGHRIEWRMRRFLSRL